MDSDDDGMPDAFEQKFFGSPTAAVASEDFDGDGVSNLSEYVAGTIPTDARSRFSAEIRSESGGQASITFARVPGRRYRLQCSKDLVLFKDVADARQQNLGELEGRFMVSSGSGFFRVVVELE